ncbi:uncharacterized protein FOMMEDRAFT_150820 [Fomitiporia mediterranea MF3/22]|uniref:uncharacterized protein n=1 Tax=Fomitiporia mediterranea (strain MF3/22) TaxID=694068 RepID=UPI000440748C|nr:uncharacterized protein FOMMEDRAFT_150820 [Fomitiporia mediterranea MF3/22]EJD08130.1 hypothetical protein FOMMEDRAFT_150820 [Fomitiporia mediterranea MF3/22]
MVSELLRFTFTLLVLALSDRIIASSISECNSCPNDHPRVRPYHNLVISGFAPNPSCTRVGEQFFCVTSSFSAFLGIPVYTSRDLVQWQQIEQGVWNGT